MKENPPKNTKNDPTPRSRKALKIFLTVLNILLILISSLALCLGIYLHSTYPNEKLEQLLFYLTNGVADSGSSAFIEGALAIALPMLLISVLLILLQYDFFGKHLTIKHKNKKSGKETHIQLYPIKHRLIFTPIVALILIGIGLGQVGFFEYFRSQTVSSDFIENEYVNPAKTTVMAPDQKRNIIVIELESLETSMFTKKQGGVWTMEVIPELYGLLDDEDAIFFASDGKNRGALDAFGTTWTTASLIANTSGIPFKVPAGLNNSYHSKHFLKGAVSLGDILKKNGYRNILISGSETSFGGVADYFTCHGEYEIIDEKSCKDYGLEIPLSQRNEWGFSDEACFKFAEEIIKRNESEDPDTPWHLMISTIDCHFGGYIYSPDPVSGYTGSVNKFGRQLNNVYATTSRVVGEFISWLKAQPFYENTTVVIFGDHRNMLESFCPEADPDARGRYNLIINSAVTTENTKNRVFTAFDMFPTILAASGFEITGNRLALGVNLFAPANTLSEFYGIDYMNEQLELRSEFYIDNIMGRSDSNALDDMAKKYEDKTEEESESGTSGASDE